MLHLRLWAKILSMMGLALATVGAILSWYQLNSLNQIISKAEQNELSAHVRSITNSIAAEARLAEAMSALVAEIPQVQEAFANGDREAVSALFVSGFKTMRDRYGVEQFQFHTPPAISWLRVHMPQRFGDDLSSFRHTVVNTNQKREATRGLEGGVAGIGVRGMVPIMHNNQHLGSVEFGMSFGQPFFDEFKARNGVEAALYFPKDGEYKRITSTLQGTQPLLGNDKMHAALQGVDQLGHVESDGIHRAVIAHTVTDFSGKPIGIIEVAMDSSSYKKAVENSRATLIKVAILSVVLGLILAILLSRHLSRRLKVVAYGMNEIASGNLRDEVKLSGRDEIATLAQNAREMRDRLHQVVAAVSNNARLVQQAAQEIAVAVDSQAATSSQMSSSVAEITSTMEELSASSTQIADHSRSVVEIANQTLDGSRKGSEGMQTVLARMGDIRSDNQHSLQEIISLGSKSKQISHVMEIINTLADQTRLIAFNAALEASSAGEAGKRFSVVASEIRRLADSVTESTGEIEGQISAIQESIQRLVITSEKGGQSITAGMSACNHTAERLATIVNAATQTSNAAQQISLSTQQQKTASSQVVIALREIVTASAHTADSITRISQISREMNNFSNHLDGLVRQFQLKE
jgi:methyl-accepting chemotaxis protein